MTRKDFQLIADALSEAQADVKTVYIMSEALKKTNDQFDRKKFFDAYLVGRTKNALGEFDTLNETGTEGALWRKR